MRRRLFPLLLVLALTGACTEGPSTVPSSDVPTYARGGTGSTECGGRGQPACEDTTPPPPPGDDCGSRGQPACEDTTPPPPLPPPPPGDGETVLVSTGQSWSGTSQKVCINDVSCKFFNSAQDVTVFEFIVDGTGLDPWPLGNQGLITIQAGGGQTTDLPSGIVIRDGIVQNCPPGEGGVIDKEHHAALRIAKGEAPILIENVEIGAGCLSSVYLKFLGSGVTFRGNWFRAGRVGHVRFDDTVWESNRMPAGGPYFQTVDVFNDPVDRITFRGNSVIGGTNWGDGTGHVIEFNVFVGDSGLDPAQYPNNCFLPAADPDEVFVNWPAGDFTLRAPFDEVCAGHGV